MKKVSIVLKYKPSIKLHRFLFFFFLLLLFLFLLLLLLLFFFLLFFFFLFLLLFLLLLLLLFFFIIILTSMQSFLPFNKLTQMYLFFNQIFLIIGSLIIVGINIIIFKRLHQSGLFFNQPDRKISQSHLHFLSLL